MVAWEAVDHARFMSWIIVTLAAVLWVAADLWSQSLSDSVLTARVAARPDTPLILFTSVPAFGSFTGLKGKVYNVDPGQYRVAVFIFISTGHDGSDCSSSRSCRATKSQHESHPFLRF